MMRVTTFEQLEDMTSRLFIEVICPHCEMILISTMQEAQMILVFGCPNCANIDTSALLSFNNFPISNIPVGDSTEIPIC